MLMEFWYKYKKLIQVSVVHSFKTNIAGENYYNNNLVSNAHYVPFETAIWPFENDIITNKLFSSSCIPTIVSMSKMFMESQASSKILTMITDNVSKIYTYSCYGCKCYNANNSCYMDASGTMPITAVIWMQVVQFQRMMFI